jgi:hypothetical protein
LADVAVYTYAGTASAIGNGALQTIKLSGYFVIDLDSVPPNQGASVGLTQIGSSAGFSEVPLDASVIAPVVGPGGKTYTLIADAESPLATPSGSTAATQLKYEGAFGLNSLVQVRVGGPFKSLPKSMTSPFMIIGKDSGAYYVQRGQLTYKFDARATLWANYNNYSLSYLVDYARNFYLMAGYPEW